MSLRFIKVPVPGLLRREKRLDPFEEEILQLAREHLSQMQDMHKDYLKRTIESLKERHRKKEG